MTMSVTYKFSSMASLADYFENKAKEKRESAGWDKLTKTRARELRAEASSLEMVAHTIRNTTIGDP